MTGPGGMGFRSRSVMAGHRRRASNWGEASLRLRNAGGRSRQPDPVSQAWLWRERACPWNAGTWRRSVAPGFKPIVGFSAELFPGDGEWRRGNTGPRPAAVLCPGCATWNGGMCRLWICRHMYGAWPAPKEASGALLPAARCTGFPGFVRLTPLP